LLVGVVYIRSECCERCRNTKTFHLENGESRQRTATGGIVRIQIFRIVTSGLLSETRLVYKNSPDLVSRAESQECQ